MTTLAHLRHDSRAVVAELPRARGLAERLIALGLTPGAEVRVLQNRGHGPLIVEVHGARLALGRGQAARVMVEVAGLDAAEAEPTGTDLGGPRRAEE
jgi:ferrous iron transport protein A